MHPHTDTLALLSIHYYYYIQIVSVCLEVLLAGQLGVEAAESDGEGLQSTQREAVVHGEHLAGYPAKLQYYVVV